MSETAKAEKRTATRIMLGVSALAVLTGPSVAYVLSHKIVTSVRQVTVAASRHGFCC